MPRTSCHDPRSTCPGASREQSDDYGPDSESRLQLRDGIAAARASRCAIRHRSGREAASIQSVFSPVPALLLVRGCPYVLSSECGCKRKRSQTRNGWPLTREVNGGSDGTRTRDLRLDRPRRPTRNVRAIAQLRRPSTPTMSPTRPKPAPPVAAPCHERGNATRTTPSSGPRAPRTRRVRAGHAGLGTSHRDASCARGAHVGCGRRGALRSHSNPAQSI